jgi:hypothetical protein
VIRIGIFFEKPLLYQNWYHMKKLLLSAAMVLSLAFLNESSAQLRIGVNINIGDQPRWRPAGYDYAEYYYLPDIETYYYVPQRQFIYLSNGRWMFSSSLPSRYSNYDLYTGQKVVINRPNAYRYFNEDRYRYGGQRNYGYEQHNRGWHKGWNKKKYRNRF